MPQACVPGHSAPATGFPRRLPGPLSEPPVDSPGVACKNMGIIEPPEEMMDQILTLEEIEARYAPEWVLIGDPQTDEKLHLQAGRVLFHSPDGEEVCRKAAEFPAGRYALRFLGERPEDVVLVL